MFVLNFLYLCKKKSFFPSYSLAYPVDLIMWSVLLFITFNISLYLLKLHCNKTIPSNDLYSTMINFWELIVPWVFKHFEKGGELLLLLLSTFYISISMNAFFSPCFWSINSLELWIHTLKAFICYSLCEYSLTVTKYYLHAWCDRNIVCVGKFCI